MKERLISFIRLVDNRNLKYLDLLDIFYVSNSKTEFCEYSNINVFKHEESDKVGVDSTHTQRACGGESIDSPIVGVFHSPTINVKYVFVCSNIVTLFVTTLINVYLINNQEIN